MLQKLDAERVAGTRKLNAHIGLHLSGMGGHDQHPVREVYRLSHVMRDVDHRLAGLPPDIRQQPLHLVSGQRIECRERLVHQQHRRIVGKRPRNGDPLLHSTG